ncbi:serine/threonine-protein kinase [Urbifossiella limnaea]|uniref:non-specific serine/threonine protein kinase n=1 Tax=Urbifossiella limnaea TaxID=2528023 RepID=A0A517XP85_9BACT|nr:serine/threonine-protein kinase [Urbifossiella limnaea]QDU19317.1 Serine/threonine-protein kinase PrkC [Urbifossiella limnaea]
MPDAPSDHTLPSAGAGDLADLSGRTLGGFQLVRKIGAGGMGQVYLARQLSLKRPVALKLLKADLTKNPTALKRFEAEAHAVAKLNHPNIVQVYEFGEHDGLRYMALEYVEGRNLREYLARKGPPELAVALSMMRQIATALTRAHEQGLVHRDIKPENILVTKRVEVKVTDFGLSRFFAPGEALNLTQSGVTLGTPLYLSPEQAQGKAVDHRSDLYSFGVTAYHLLAGEPPFRGSTAVEVALKHVTDRPPPLAGLRPDLPADLCGLVHKLMAKEPGDRYQSAREVLRDLAKVKEGLTLGLPPRPPGAPLPPTPSGPQPTALTLSGTVSGSAATLGFSGVVPVAPPVRWGRWVAAGLLAVVAAAGGAAGYAALHPPPAPPTRPAPPPLVGLPDVRPPERITTARERELVAALDRRKTPPDEWNAAAIELALLYLREGRLDDADARFEQLEKAPFVLPVATAEAKLAGKLGRGVVLAYRDGDPKHPDAAKESTAAFQAALALPIPAGVAKAKADKGSPPPAVVWAQGFLYRHPDLAHAVAEALTRDAANGVRLPPPLEALRAPRAAGKSG